MCIVVWIPTTLDWTKTKLVHILKCVITSVVHNDIHNDTDSMFVSCINESLELCLCTEVCVRFGVVKDIVAMVWIVSETVSVTTYAITMNLLIWSRKPDSINTKVIEVTFIDFLCDTSKVTALESCILVIVCNITILVKTSAVAMVIRCVSVIETVSK